MDELAKLSALLTARGAAGFPLLDLPSVFSAKETQLIEALAKSPETTKNQLVKDFYGRNTPANLDAFYQLRTRVRTKLLNYLYFLDHTDPRHAVSRRYELGLMAMLHQATVLYAEGEYQLAEQRFRRCVVLARRDELYLYAMLATKQLRNLYVLQRKTRQYRKMVADLVRWQQLLSWEEEAEHLHMAFRMAAGSKVDAQGRLLPELAGYVEQIRALHEKAHTFNTFWYAYRAKLYEQQMRGNFAEIVRITTEANQLLETGQLNAHRFDKRYNHFMLAHGHLGARQAGAGLELAERHLLDFHPADGSWFTFQENHLLLALHAGQFAHAQRVLTEVMNNAFFAKQLPAAQQRWDLYRVYVAFLSPTARQQFTRLPPVQWLLTLPDFNRDKRGYHVAIVIAQLLYFLHLRNLDEATVRLERLRKYQLLHLHDAETLRSRLFLRLLALLGTCDFNARLCASRGESLLAKLRQVPTPGEAYAELEIIPYENLWDLTLKIVQHGVPLTSRVR